MPFTILWIVTDEGDEFDIRPVLETDESVFGPPTCVNATGGYGEVFGYPGREVEELGVGDENNYVIEVERHSRW